MTSSVVERKLSAHNERAFFVSHIALQRGNLLCVSGASEVNDKQEQEAERDAAAPLVLALALLKWIPARHASLSQLFTK